MSSRQAALLPQLEAGPSTQPWQEGVQHSFGADLSRQDELLLRAFKAVGLRQGRSETMLRFQDSALRHLCRWLHKQTALQPPILHGLDSLKKLRDHPNENDVKSLINRFTNDPATDRSAKDFISAAVTNLRKWMPQAPAPAESRTAQTTLQRRHFGPFNQSANLAPPHNSDLPEELDITSGEAALHNQIFHGEADEQDDASSVIPHAQAPEASTSGAQPHGVRRPAPEVDNESRAVRPRLDDSPPPTIFEELERFLGI